MALYTKPMKYSSETLRLMIEFLGGFNNGAIKTRIKNKRR